MTTASVAVRQSRLASAVSDVLGPLPVGIALCIAGEHDGWSAGSSIGWGLLALLLLAVVPYLATRRARHPKNRSRPSAKAKGVYMAVVAAIALVGFVVLLLLNAPPAVIRTALTIVVTLILTAVATGLAGLSNHASACAAGVAMCCVLGGLPWLALAACVVAVGASRIALRRHSFGQVIGGVVLGAAVAGCLLSILV